MLYIKKSYTCFVYMSLDCIFSPCACFNLLLFYTITFYSGLQPKSNRLYVQPRCLEGYTTQVCASTHCDDHTTKLPNNAFLRMYPIGKWCMTVLLKDLFYVHDGISELILFFVIAQSSLVQGQHRPHRISWRMFLLLVLKVFL